MLTHPCSVQFRMFYFTVYYVHFCVCHVYQTLLYIFFNINLTTWKFEFENSTFGVVTCWSGRENGPVDISAKEWSARLQSARQHRLFIGVHGMAMRCAAQPSAHQASSVTSAFPSAPAFAEINNEAMRRTLRVSWQTTESASIILSMFIRRRRSLGYDVRGWPRRRELPKRLLRETRLVVACRMMARRDALYKCVSTSHRNRRRKHVFSIQLADAWLMIVLAAAGVALSSRRYSKDDTRHPVSPTGATPVGERRPLGSGCR